MSPTKAEAFDLSSVVPIAKPRPMGSKFSAILYAPPKTGKTRLCGSAVEVPELSPVLLLATEDGTSVLSGLYDEVDVAQVSGWPQAFEVIKAVAGIKSYEEGVMTFHEKPQTPYKTIIIDTISELQELMKSHTSETGYGLWAYIADYTIAVVKMLHKSPHVNVIFTTHPERVQDDTGKVMNSPYFLGKKSLGEVLKPIDLILYLGVKEVDGEVHRILQTKPNGKNDAGDRSGKLVDFIVDPTMTEIYAQLTKKN